MVVNVCIQCTISYLKRHDDSAQGVLLVYNITLRSGTTSQFFTITFVCVDIVMRYINNLTHDEIKQSIHCDNYLFFVVLYVMMTSIIR